MMKAFLEVEDLDVYQKLCDLHIEICDCSHGWPQQERYKLGAQVRRSSNSSPSQLAEKNDDRHIKNKIEGINRARGEAGETIHHLFIARKKKYLTDEMYAGFRERYKECIRMLNGLERSIEKYLPAKERRWATAEETATYVVASGLLPSGWPPPTMDSELDALEYFPPEH